MSTTLEGAVRLKEQADNKIRKNLPSLLQRRQELDEQISAIISNVQKAPLIRERDCVAREIKKAQLAIDNHPFCELGMLLKTHSEDAQKRHAATIRQWEEEMMAQSLSIHERQKLAGTLWNRDLVIRLIAARQTIPNLHIPYRVHVNTTLPQLCLMVHEIVSKVGPENYSPVTYNFWVVKPELDDPFRSRTVAKWIELLDAKGQRDFYDEMIPIQTSIGETLFYDSGCGSLESCLDKLANDPLCILMAPRTTSEWRIPQRVGVNLEQVDTYVERPVEANLFSRTGTLYKKYMELIGAKERERQPLVATTVCPECFQPMIQIESEAMMVCPHCATSEKYIDDSIKNLPFGHGINTTRSTYKRINHFVRDEFLIVDCAIAITHTSSE